METQLPAVKATNGIADFDPFKAMDALDDEQILAEIEGRISEAWTYHFPQDGKDVWGLSKVGVDQACREMAKLGEVIREEDVAYEIDPTDERYVLFKGFASRVAVGKDGREYILDRAAGVKRQCIYVVNRDGISQKVNPFWFEQGSMKALRNARARQISEEVRSKIMTLAKEGGKVKTITAPSQAAEPRRPGIKLPAEPPPYSSVKVKLGDMILKHANDDMDTARQILRELAGKTSVRDLTEAEAEEALKSFEAQTREPGSDDKITF